MSVSVCGFGGAAGARESRHDANSDAAMSVSQSRRVGFMVGILLDQNSSCAPTLNIRADNTFVGRSHVADTV